ncbi:MAG: CHRD domain-containing protein, partial [Tepidiformaceae bacterium]
MILTNYKPGIGRAVAILAIICVSAAFLMAGSQARAANAAVTITNFAFTPATLTVAVGDTVTWTNASVSPHTVTSDASGTTLASGNIAPAGTYAKTFSAAGVFPYHCEIHSSMVGTVTVTAAATTTATATASPTATATATPTAAPTVAPTQPPSGPQAPLQPETAPINITLRGSNEVPPVTNGVASGTFRATPGASSLGFTLTASGAGMTAAHIHLGPAGSNGPVIAFLYGPNAAGTNAITQSGTITAADLIGPMAGKTWAEFMTALNTGQLYVNIHSTANPGGEIRAQIPATVTGAAPGPPKTGNTAPGSENGSMMLFAALGLGGLLLLGAGST